MNWRHVAFLITSVIVLVLLALYWVNTYVVSIKHQNAAAIAASRPVPPTPASPPNLTVTTYYYEVEDNYRFALHYTIENVGGRTAKNIRITIRPWGRPDVNEPQIKRLMPTEEMMQTRAVDSLTKLDPREKVERVISFDRPNDPEQPLPSPGCYGYPFVTEFDSE